MNVPPEDQAGQVEALLDHYSFDLGGKPAGEIVAGWSRTYDVDWLPLAVIEALYLGRYKAISVGQILAHWKRRDRPIYHFNSEFERLVCNHLPPHLTGSFSEKTGDRNRVNNDQNDFQLPSKEGDQSPPKSIHYADFHDKLKSLIDADINSPEAENRESGSGNR